MMDVSDRVITHALGSGMVEKTYIEKALAKEDIVKLRDILKKSLLSREDMLEIRTFISSVESKLLNIDAMERYNLNKFFTWLANIVHVAETFSDYHESVMTNLKTKNNNEENKNMISSLDYCQKKLSNMVKMTFEIYFNMSRSSLSLNAKAFEEVTGNRFEMNYNDNNNNQIHPPQNSGGRLFGLGK